MKDKNMVKIKKNQHRCDNQEKHETPSGQSPKEKRALKNPSPMVKCAPSARPTLLIGRTQGEIWNRKRDIENPLQACCPSSP